MLTPLVDIMFLMLIFFMVSSQTSPYSLLTIQAAAETPRSMPAAPQSAANAPLVRVTVFGGYVSYNGQRVELAALRASVELSRAAGAKSAVVLNAPSATVQDVVSVVEAFQSAQFGDVQLVMRQGATS